ncbi:uncharacterized protein LOC120369525 [Mauremys reevesii]|uniref:uncharacterized protein LOC120369525 n=1 Tax=Mauremys reevesii TaxID=260615 RepID=UPI00193F0707|nr:uncharacterized protein LOC120369525 [Mauremys reevesii]
MGRVVVNEGRWGNGSKGRETGLADDPYLEKWDQAAVNGIYAEKRSQGTPEDEEPSRRPDWAELWSSDPAPQRVKRRPGSIKAGPPSSVRRQPSEGLDVCDRAPAGEAAEGSGRPSLPLAHYPGEAWQSLPHSSCPEEEPSLPRTHYPEEDWPGPSRSSYPNEEPNLLFTTYPEDPLNPPGDAHLEEPMVADPCADTTTTQNT